MCFCCCACIMLLMGSVWSFTDIRRGHFTGTKPIVLWMFLSQWSKAHMTSYSPKRCRFTCIGIPIMNIIRPEYHLRFMVGIEALNDMGFVDQYQIAKHNKARTILCYSWYIQCIGERDTHLASRNCIKAVLQLDQPDIEWNEGLCIRLCQHRVLRRQAGSGRMSSR